MIPGGPGLDFTKHIEANWGGKPESLVLCIRYNGRRVGIVNPGVADRYFCDAYEPPSDSPSGKALPLAAECNVSDFLEGKLVYLPELEAERHYPVIVHSHSAPCLRYAAVFW